MKEAQQNQKVLSTEIERLSKETEAEEPTIINALEIIENAATRLYIRMHYLRGLEWKEIAGIAQKSYITVSNRVYNALKRINESQKEVHFRYNGKR